MNNVNFIFYYADIIKKSEDNKVHEHHKNHINLFLKSIKTYHPDCKIIQCTDFNTEVFSDANEVFRSELDESKLMEGRIKSYAKLNISEPSIYLDTDMLVMKRIPFESFIDNAEIFLLSRSFDKDQYLTTNFRGQNFENHNKGSLGAIYPYIGCLVIAKTNEFWKVCSNYYDQLEDKYKFWFGDQEVLKKTVLEKKFEFAFLQESEFACPPFYIDETKRPFIIHFKGKNTKNLIEKYYQYIR